MSRDCPLVFACSGCSGAGHLADHVARELDRRGVAEMSCLAGVGAGKRQFLKILSGRQVWIVDGCPVECAQGVFDQAGQPVDLHIQLKELGVKKNAAMPTDAKRAQLMKAVMSKVSERRDGLGAESDRTRSDQQAARAVNADPTETVQSTSPDPIRLPVGTETGNYFVSNYPPYSQWRTEQVPDFEASLLRPHRSEPLGLYVHLPFCRQRCMYCYFRVHVRQANQYSDRYIQALLTVDWLLPQFYLPQHRNVRYT